MTLKSDINFKWKNTILIYAVFLISVNFLSGQELPPIQSFTPQEYQGENQNWAITQGWDNHIYIANNHNLLQYDGVRWSTNTSPNASIFRSVAAKDSLIFTGQYMEFGYWKKNDFSELTYTSVSDLLKEPMVEDEEFWNILVLGDWVLFQSLDRIYSFNTETQVFNILNVKSTKAQIFRVDDTVYFQSQNFGIYKIENGAAVLVLDHLVLQNRSVVGIYKQEGQLLVILDDAQFLKINAGTIKSLELKAASQLKGLNIYCTQRLKDGSFILGTISKGIFHISQDGNLLRTINQRKGLNNNTILSTFQDKDDNLWLGLDNGLGVVNINSRFNEYQDNLGRLGLVYTSMVFNGNLYLGTNQGLFVINKNRDDDFELIPGTDGQVWSLTIVDETLFCGHNNGTYLIKDKTSKLISKLPGTWVVKELDTVANILLQGNYDGLSTLKKEKGIWKFGNKISGFDTSSRFLEILGNNKILVNHEYKGLFELTLSETYDRIIATKQHPIMGHGSSMVNFQEDIIYTSIDGAFKKNRDSLVFTPDTILNKLLFDEAGGINSILLTDKHANRLWSFTNNGLSYIYPDRFNASLDITMIPIPKFLRTSLGVSGFENLTRIADEKYLIGISNGFVILDTDKESETASEIRIEQASNSMGFESPNKMSFLGKQELDFEHNTINFMYSVPQFDKYTEVSYQYRLIGFFNEWSEWSTTADISFSNLDYGSYTFEVRAKKGNTITSNIAQYDFHINRPWYWSIPAIILYILGLILVFFSVHRIYKSYYTKKQERVLKLEKKKLKRNKLKTEKELIQVKNEKLQNEIESKNRELAISTMSIIKKNQFLNAIKEQLNKEEASSNLNSIIKTIDKNIENEDDWKFFEEAFNNADKKFLQTLQSKHSELTPNDLRLCAYLRLNLSSKEIAPLLNISSKSVEVKRYRLRKKMNLAHEVGLTDYILSL